MSTPTLKKVGSNVTELHAGDGAVVLFSYSTPVAALIPGSGWFRTAKRHSVTTSGHVNRWVPAGVEVEERPQSWFDGLLPASVEGDR
jgi:hypothetical protein